MSAYKRPRFRVQPYSSDGHSYWEIDLDAMAAGFWAEAADDDWSVELYPIRRQGEGWQYLEDDQKWAACVAQLRDDAVRFRANLSEDMFPKHLKAVYRDELGKSVDRVHEANETGAGWRFFPDDVSHAIEQAWLEDSR